jgi:hypothetical protein
MSAAQAEIIDLANVKTQRAAAAVAARAASDAAELAAMFAVRKMVDAIAADKARGKLASPGEYLARLFNQEKQL